MHASISAHIANDYQLDEFLGRWGPSLQQFQQRLGNPGARGYVENLYFSYLFTLRAVQKAAPLLQVHLHTAAACNTLCLADSPVH